MPTVREIEEIKKKVEEIRELIARKQGAIEQLRKSLQAPDSKEGLEVTLSSLEEEKVDLEDRYRETEEKYLRVCQEADSSKKETEPEDS